MNALPVPPPEAKEGIFAGYTREPWPLGGYAALVGGFLAGTSAFLYSAARSQRTPKKVRVRDIVLLGIATHKLTRIITKDWVTSPLRAPFTKFEKSLGGGEQVDKSRGTGLRRAIGDLLTCHFCSGPWVATALYAGLIYRPRETRLMASMLASVAASDYLHHAWEITRSAAQQRHP